MHTKLEANQILKGILCILPFLAFWEAANMAHAEDLSPRFDASFQIAVLDMREHIGEKPLGVGGRFGYGLTGLVNLDGGLVHFPEDPSGNFGETLGLAGVRIGKRFDTFGVFAKARAGAINFGGRASDLRLSDTMHPAFDLGTMLEFYAKKNFFVRLDLGDCIIPFGNTTYPSAEGQPIRLGIKHNLLMEFGLGFRF
jgi:hypothetical protein